MIDNIPNKEAIIWRKLLGAGYEAYLVGGAVRDVVAGNQPKDYDFATNAIPGQIADVFRGHKVDFVGANFGVMLVDGVEVAGYRIDKHDIENGNCEVSYISDLTKDLERRDFTMNAMALSQTGDLIDPHEGLKHIHEKEIHFVFSPALRIQEDPVRMLRAAKFSARLNFGIAPFSFRSMRKLAWKIAHVPGDRVSKEVMEVLSTVKRSSRFFTVLFNTTILDYVCPSMALTFGKSGGPYHKESVWQHILLAGDHVSCRFPLVKLAAYLHDVGKPVTYDCLNESFITHEKVGAKLIRKQLGQLRFSNQKINTVAELTYLHMHQPSSARSVRKLRKKLDLAGFSWRDFLRLRIADRAANLAKEPFTISDIKEKVRLFNTEPELPMKVTDLVISGADIIKEFGIPPGPKVGEIQRHLLYQVLTRGESFNTEVILKNFCEAYLIASEV